MEDRFGLCGYPSTMKRRSKQQASSEVGLCAPITVFVFVLNQYSPLIQYHRAIFVWFIYIYPVKRKDWVHFRFYNLIEEHLLQSPHTIICNRFIALIFLIVHDNRNGSCRLLQVKFLVEQQAEDKCVCARPKNRWTRGIAVIFPVFSAFESYFTSVSCRSTLAFYLTLSPMKSRDLWRRWNQ